MNANMKSRGGGLRTAEIRLVCAKLSSLIRANWRLPRRRVRRRVIRGQMFLQFLLIIAGGGYVHSNMKGILMLKRWRSRMRLPRLMRRKRLRQLELNLWPTRLQNSSKQSSRPFENRQNAR